MVLELTLYIASYFFKILVFLFYLGFGAGKKGISLYLCTWQIEIPHPYSVLQGLWLITKQRLRQQAAFPPSNLPLIEERKQDSLCWVEVCHAVVELHLWICPDSITYQDTAVVGVCDWLSLNLKTGKNNCAALVLTQYPIMSKWNAVRNDYKLIKNEKLKCLESINIQSLYYGKPK